jgi:DNA-binding GntR family transcriptional regulator
VIGDRPAAPPAEPDATHSPKPLRDLIADSIREQVITGAIKPGRRIREDEIAQDHGVSRVPVREALQKLESEGYLTLTRYRGATVTMPSAERALQAREVRRGLEVMAARLAARARGGPAAAQLVRLVERGSRAVDERRYKAIPELVSRFHELVAVASGTPEIVQILALYRGKVDWMFSVDLEDRAEGSWDDHAAILEAILAGDEELAGRRMDEHTSKDEDACRRHVHQEGTAAPAAGRRARSTRTSTGGR